MRIKVTTRLLAYSLGFIGLSACEKPAEVVEIGREAQRELCQFDKGEKFRDIGSFLFWKDRQPLHWKRLNRTKFRMLNYLTDDGVEIAFSLVGGSLEGNANRWLKQFGQPVGNNKRFETADMLGSEGMLVETQGTFQGRENYALIGALQPYQGNQIVSVKMTGPAAAVAKEKEHFLAYLKTIQFDAIQKGAQNE